MQRFLKRLSVMACDGNKSVMRPITESSKHRA